MIRLAFFMEKEPDQRYFRVLLKNRPGFLPVCAGKSGIEAMQMIRRHRPDIALLDENLPGMSRGRLVTAILLKFRHIKLIVAAANPAKPGAAVLQAIRAGAAGCCGKAPEAEHFFRGLLVVMHGGSMMSPETAAAAFRLPPSARAPLQEDAGRKSALPARFTEREIRMTACAAGGMSCREIAEILGLSCGTVRNCFSALYKKTGLRNRSAVILHLHRTGLLDREQL